MTPTFRKHHLQTLWIAPFARPFFLLFSPSPPSPSFLNPSPSSDLKTPPFPRGIAIFRGWGAARVLGEVTPQKKRRNILKKWLAKSGQLWIGALMHTGMAQEVEHLPYEILRETEVQRRRGTTSPDPEKIPEPLRGPLGGFPVGILREEKTLRASKGQFSPRSSRRLFHLWCCTSALLQEMLSTPGLASPNPLGADVQA